MPEEKKWRDAKMPQWVKDQIEEELKAAKIHSALAWPREARPEPIPFRWGEYDMLKGEAVAGIYWTPDRGGSMVHIREKRPEDRTFKKWVFSSDGQRWSDSVHRGPLFATRYEAQLEGLWKACFSAAETLFNHRKYMDRSI